MLINFHCMDKKHWKISHNIFYAPQKKESQTGLEWLDGENVSFILMNFWIEQTIL